MEKLLCYGLHLETGLNIVLRFSDKLIVPRNNVNRKRFVKLLDFSYCWNQIHLFGTQLCQSFLGNKSLNLAT